MVLMIACSPKLILGPSMTSMVVTNQNGEVQRGSPSRLRQTVSQGDNFCL